METTLRPAAFIACACACGRIGFDPNADAIPASDGGFGPWQAPSAVLELTSGADDATPSVPDDELEIVFESTRINPMVFQVWSASRADAGAPWTNVMQVVIPATTSGAEPALSPDGLELMFLHNTTTLARTTRPTRASGWAAPVSVTELVGFYGVDFVEHNRLVMYSGTPPQLYETTRADALSPWAAPRKIAELASTAPRDFPTATRDGLELIFEDGVPMSQQLARAVRPAIDEPFGTPEPIRFGPPFDGAVVGDPELSVDGTTLWFVSNMNGPFHIYVTHRTRL